MNADGRITLYGGAPISAALVLVGGVTNEPTIALTGSYFAGATLAIAFLFDHLETSTAQSS